jgi:hypothetical protein
MELEEAKQLIVNWIPGSENNAEMFTKNLDGPLFKKYVEILLREHGLGGKGGDTSEPKVRGVSGGITLDLKYFYILT